MISGDLWAGAEVSAFHLILEMMRRPNVSVRVVALNRGSLVSKLLAAGVTTIVIPESEVPFSRQISRLVGIAKTWSPEVIHTHRYKENILGTAAAGTLGSFHVRTAHGMAPDLEWGRRPKGLGHLLDRAIADFAGSTWIAVSRDLATRIGGMRRSVYHVPNGLPASPFVADRPGLESAFDDDRPAWILGFVGRFEPVKRPDRFVRLMSQLPHSVGGKEVRGIMLGDGGLRAAIEEAICRAGLAGRVKVLGHRDDGGSLLAAMDVLLIPSDHEGHPMVLLEAMRSGVPIVASGVGGIPEVLGLSRWLSKPEDEAGAARRIEELLQDGEARARWGSELRERFFDGYRIEHTTDLVLEIYRTGIRTAF